MNIGYYVPSRARVGRVHTLAYLPKEILKHTTVVCSHTDSLAAYADAYKGVCNVVQATKSVDTIGKKRDWILKQAVAAGQTHIVMLDDDLVFARRRSDDPTKFTDAGSKDMQDLFKEITAQLKKFAHVGILAREGGNRITDEFRFNMRTMRVLGYSVEVLQMLKFKFERADLMCDFDATLTLLRNGFPNVVICGWVQNQSGSNLLGGCSMYRTEQRQTEAAELLKKRHSDFVKIVQKETKTAWGGGTRTDVVVAWKKAYESSSLKGA